ncbi:DUF99 family protein [Vibrio sp. CAU 1672]|uniref:endonuclease dU n=1 Tax=Vibrio sp. CAU 1672 TaxID=3032594 RepID=UPI0023DBCFE9|nr:DUF99 family protein [Vibrio sp. CAU 1672]MDF2154534.1 DUF99 family protein [Vibrio sp. CAU 1672]
MKPLEELLRLNRQIRVIGFDDAPFERRPGALVHISGIVCSGTRFEGMLWGETTKDGNDATEVISTLLKQSKFYEQVNVVLTDGLTVGGFNLIDLPALAEVLQRPCIAVMRKPPDMAAIDYALQHFPDYEQRKSTLLKAGPIYTHHAFVYQACGCEPETAAQVLALLTDTGNVPEALRLAHMIGAAVVTGESNNRA